MMNTLNIFAASILKAGDIGFTGPQSAGKSLQSALNVAYFWGGALAVLIIIVAGFYYVTANGNAQQITRAKDTIVYAVVGVAVILGAFVLTNFVIGRF